MTKNNLKFILAVALSCVSLTAIAISAIRVGEIGGDTVTETLLTVVPLGSIGAVIVIILLFVSACEEKDAARCNNTIPKRRGK